MRTTISLARLPHEQKRRRAREDETARRGEGRNFRPPKRPQTCES